MLLGVKYLHSETPGKFCVIHRDLKPANLLLDDCFRVKISDFGLAKLQQNGEASTTRLGCGTAAYMAPECWRDDNHLTEKVDIWAVGLIIYEVLFGRCVFTKAPLLIMRDTNDPVARPAIPAWVHPVVREIIERCWSVEPDNRYSIEHIWNLLTAEHYPFFDDVDVGAIEGYIAEVEREVARQGSYLEPGSPDRPTAGEDPNHPQDVDTTDLT
jgi:serine/threonine protein kinase